MKRWRVYGFVLEGEVVPFAGEEQPNVSPTVRCSKMIGTDLLIATDDMRDVICFTIVLPSFLLGATCMRLRPDLAGSRRANKLFRDRFLGRAIHLYQ